MKLNVNEASRDELTAVGVRPALADAILAFRDRHGAIGTIDELLAVPRLGRASLERLSQVLDARPVAPAAPAPAQPEGVAELIRTQIAQNVATMSALSRARSWSDAVAIQSSHLQGTLERARHGVTESVRSLARLAPAFPARD